MFHNFTTVILLAATSTLFGQTGADSIPVQVLGEIAIKAQVETIQRLPPAQGTFLWAGKKNEVINLQNLDANIAEKNPRQIFAKVPGVFVYDMDGTGNQTNIATRGLDPHRGWEFNIRADRVLTNSDMYGYPASHFSLPMEAVCRIELVRGTGALQYGAQFGGMLNYVLKEPDTSRALGFETVNSAGSYGLLSTYNAAGGKIGRVQYYAYYSKRVSSGYRANSATKYDGQGLVVKYTLSPACSLRAELLRSSYRYQIPGPLTDSMFLTDPRQATRSRNYFNPELYIPSLSLEWAIAEHIRLSWTTSAVVGARRSVQFDRPANVPDTISPVSLRYAPRQVDVDHFNSYTSELRMLTEYNIFGKAACLVAGIQLMRNDLHRQQLGLGSVGTDFDLSISAAGWARDLHFKTSNLAVFAENKFQITPKLSLSPGIRLETGQSRMSGTITYFDPSDVPRVIRHQFPLFGLNASYATGSLQNIYAGWSQAYRPVIFKDIIPGSVYERTDKNIKDAIGYNLEVGWRGTAGNLKWDISAFHLQYNHRPGSLAVEDDGTLYLLRTNIGNSTTHGLELFGEYGFQPAGAWRFNIFTSTAWLDARYRHAMVRINNKNQSIDGNQVESAPPWISRNGLNIKYKIASATFQYSYTARSYADPLNSVTPSASGAVGLVPAYGLLDFNASVRLFSNALLRFSINNLTNKSYFTKRPTFYPGPGVWPSDGRSAVVSVAVKW